MMQTQSHAPVVKIGTKFSETATKVMFLGAGELGKEVIIEMQRKGIEVIAVDRYHNAPGMQVADRSHVISMLDGDALEAIIKKENPTLIVPEIEAIATDRLVQLEKEGFTVIPTAKAAQLTMDRKGIRTLAAQKLGLPTSEYLFVDNYQAFEQAVTTLQKPCVAKPSMSSSGAGQVLITEDITCEQAWQTIQSECRGKADTVIVEKFVDFDYEITLLTVQHKDGVSFCPPIGHRQEHGDYVESWMPHAMKPETLKKAEAIAKTITSALGGYGLFGVEFFIKGDTVLFSEVSPRPHDTGMVTLATLNMSEFELHARAILGLPIGSIELVSPGASHSFLVTGTSKQATYSNLEHALSVPNTDLRLFGKPEVKGTRRMGVATATAATIEEAREKAHEVIKRISVTL